MTAQIELEKNKFYCNGNKVSLYDLTCIMENDTQAFDLIKKADSNNFYCICYMAVGGGFLGYSIHDVLKEKEHDWLFTGIGSGLLVIGVSLYILSKKQAKKAVELYNYILKKNKSVQIKTQLGFNNVALVLTF